MNATFAPELAVVLSFHGVVERIEHPEIQVNHVDLESFERIVELVRERYEVVSLDDIAAAVRGEASLPANAAALTFDDAYRSVLELADPAAERRCRTPCSCPSGLIDSGSRVPTYVMRAALAFTEEPSVQLPGRRRPFKLRTADDRERAAGHAAELLRSLPRAEVEDVLLAPAGAAARRAVGGGRRSVRQRGVARLGRAALARRTRGHRRARTRATTPCFTSGKTRTRSRPGAGLEGGDRGAARRRRAVTSATRTAIRATSPGTPSRPRGTAGYSSAFMNVGGPVREGMDPLLLPRIAIAGSPPDAALAERVQLSHSKWYREAAAELGLG